jgi:Glyoxalase-like domain
MRVELDHLFVCADPGAPEAEELVRFGLREGPPSQHPGQGTANRRFSFANAMIELIWISDAQEAQSPSTKRTLLWERWSRRKDNTSPFGSCLRPIDAPDPDTPPRFTSWEYRPEYLPDPLCMHIGEAGVEEPMWVYLSFMRRARREQYFAEHPIGIRQITRLTLTAPQPLLSDASRKVLENGVLTAQTGTTHLLEIEFDDHRRNELIDFRPYLPLVFQL